MRFLPLTAVATFLALGVPGARCEGISTTDNTDLDQLATRIARMRYGAESTLETRTQRRAVLVRFVRAGKWGELRYLLLQETEHYNLRVQPLQDTVGNHGGYFRCPQDEVTALFSEEAFEKMKRYGRLWAEDAFSPPPANSTDYPRTIVPIVAKYALRDDSPLARNAEWHEVYYQLTPLVLRQYTFATHGKVTRGGNTVSCEVFIDGAGILIWHRGITMFVD